MPSEVASAKPLIEFQVLAEHRVYLMKIARMELRVLLQELLRRLPDLRVETRDPAYQFGGGDYVFIPSLNVSFTPAGADLRV